MVRQAARIMDRGLIALELNLLEAGQEWEMLEELRLADVLAFDDWVNVLTFEDNLTGGLEGNDYFPRSTP